MKFASPQRHVHECNQYIHSPKSWSTQPIGPTQVSATDLYWISVYRRWSFLEWLSWPLIMVANDLGHGFYVDREKQWEHGKMTAGSEVYKVLLFSWHIYHTGMQWSHAYCKIHWRRPPSTQTHGHSLFSMDANGSPSLIHAGDWSVEGQDPQASSGQSKVDLGGQWPRFSG